MDISANLAVDSPVCLRGLSLNFSSHVLALKNYLLIQSKCICGLASFPSVEVWFGNGNIYLWWWPLQSRPIISLGCVLSIIVSWSSIKLTLACPIGHASTTSLRRGLKGEWAGFGDGCGIGGFGTGGMGLGSRFGFGSVLLIVAISVGTGGPYPGLR